MNGLLLIDKPQGITSHDVVARVRKILQIQSVGHSGTLDPLATGLMILLVGEATKISALMIEKNKKYALKARLGETTDTLDRSGQITEKKETDHLQEKEVRQAIQMFQGELDLPIPAFSAKKVDGQKLYDKARAGESFPLPLKKMTFQDLSEVQMKLPDFELALQCTSGSFIRSWVHELGKKLHVGAHLLELQRTEVGHFQLKNAVTLEQLADRRDLIAQETASPFFIPLSQALGHLIRIYVDGREEFLVRNGSIPHRVKLELISRVDADRPMPVQLMSKNSERLLALVELEKEIGFHLRRVFQY